MTISRDQLQILLKKYHYNLLLDFGVKKNTFLYDLVMIGEHSMNFDFEKAEVIFERIKGKVDHKLEEVLRLNFKDLKRGDVSAVFSELLWSMKVQKERGEYIDFLGRVYRFNEAFFKFIYVHYEMKGDVDLFDPIFEEKGILQDMKRKHKIYNGNVIFAVEEYVKKKHRGNKQLMNVVKELTSNDMKDLIEMRHESVVGHGFKPVSEAMISEVSGSPENVISHITEALSVMGVRIYNSKYTRLNDVIIGAFDEINR